MPKALMSCKIGALAILVVSFFTHANASQCDALAARFLQQEQQAKFLRNSVTTIFFKHPATSSISLNCLRNQPNFSFFWNGAFPSNDFFSLTARAGALLTNKKENEVLKAIHRCHQHALKDPQELSSLESKGFAVECQAFIRDGGGTSISIYHNSQQ